MKNFYIRQHDSPLRWHVRRPGPGHKEHLVDLAADECACPDFLYRIAPARRSEPSGLHAIRDRCVHLVFARNFVLDLVLERLKTNFETHARDLIGAGAACPGCGSCIDPAVCYCGDPIERHGTYEHAPTPMGCTCSYAKETWPDEVSFSI